MIYHWRMLEDGRVIVLSFSEKFDDLCPPEDGVVRAELILGGYIITAISPTETLLQYVVQVSYAYFSPPSFFCFQISYPVISHLCRVI